MALHDDLLDQAIYLAHRNNPNVTEADLRRAVSSAYYAVFHLLISEACANWIHSKSRKHLARMFEHSYMRKVSNRVTDPKLMPFANENRVVVQKLRALARIFSDLQDMRMRPITMSRERGPCSKRWKKSPPPKKLSPSGTISAPRTSPRTTWYFFSLSRAISFSP